MSENFVTAKKAKQVVLEWGQQAWYCQPELTGAQALVVVDVVLFPGFGHSFHKHPRQEEVIYVLEGQVEQWVGQEKRLLQAGDSAFIGAGVVHATFNDSSENVKVLAILGPSIGEEGYEVEEVFDQEPWSGLR